MIWRSLSFELVLTSDTSIVSGGSRHSRSVLRSASRQKTWSIFTLTLIMSKSKTVHEPCASCRRRYYATRSHVPLITRPLLDE